MEPSSVSFSGTTQGQWSEPGRVEEGRRKSAAFLLFICFFMSGAAGLAYEVAWLRSLELIFGGTSYAAATVLAAFMAGLGLGSYTFGRRVGGWIRPLRTYAWLEIGIGLYLADSKENLSLVQSAQAQEAANKGEPLVSPTKARERDTFYPNTEDLGADEMRITACGTGMHAISPRV